MRRLRIAARVPKNFGLKHACMKQAASMALQQTLKEVNISQAELARRSGLSESGVFIWAKGTKLPTTFVMLRLAHGLSMDPVAYFARIIGHYNELLSRQVS